MAAQLLQVKSGERVGNGRYEVLFPLYSTENFPYEVEFSAYIVKDTKDSKCKTLQALSKDDSASVSVEVSEDIQKALDQTAQAEILSSSDSFTEKGYLCSIQELRGPLLSTLVDGQATWSAAWVAKVFHETLETLVALHASGIVHGDINPSSFVFTYPKLVDATSEKVKETYKPQGGKFSDLAYAAFNAFGSGSNGAANDLKFKVKLQNLRKATPAKEQPSDATEYISTYAPPPELLLENQISDKTDIWNLGIMLTDIIATSPEFVTLIGGREEDATDRLVAAQQYLGPLPSKYSSLAPSSAEQGVQGKDLLEEIQSSRQGKVIAANGSDADKDQFSGKSLAQAADLLKGLLKYDPAERFSAKQALAHPFFSQT